MGTNEMMGELAEAAVDMCYIARRARIAAINLRAVTAELPLGNPFDPSCRRNSVEALERRCARLATEATETKHDIAWTLAEFVKGADGAAKEGGAE